MRPEKLLKPVLEIIWEASRCCEQIAEDFKRHDLKNKEDTSPVTIADYASQALILHRLMELTPGVGIVAEEEGDALAAHPGMRDRIVSFLRPIEPSFTADNLIQRLDHGSHQDCRQSGGVGGGEGGGGTYWTLDPIDGTKGYLRGGQYAIALALVEKGVPVFGVLGCPRYAEADPKRTGMMFYGGEGMEAAMVSSLTAPPRPIRVCDTVTSAQARLCESVESAHTRHDRSKQLIDVLGISKDVLRMDSQAKYAAVAHGAAALYMRLPVEKGYREKIWDHAAGVAVIQAAGGKVTDLNGKVLDFAQGSTLAKNRGILASNGAIHHATLAALQVLTPDEAKWE